MHDIRFSPKSEKYLRKLKDKNLKKLFLNAFYDIQSDPMIGETKTGDLVGIYGYDVYYNKTNYEIAYSVEEIDDKIVVVIMLGTRENFYEELKRYMKLK